MLSVSISDIDSDGHPDLYVSAFISFPAFRSATFNDPTHAKLNVMLRNNGDLTFTDITAQSNTAGMNNTFHTVFADLDNDRDPDMILSQNTGEIEIFENDGKGCFPRSRRIQGLVIGWVSRSATSTMMVT